MWLADRTGLEPATSAVTGRHSNQLNYRSGYCCVVGGANIGGRGGIKQIIIGRKVLVAQSGEVGFGLMIVERKVGSL